jgi:ABC-type sugar transport system permease subunit
MSTTARDLVPPESRAPSGVQAKGVRSGKVRRLSKRDKVVLSFMVGIPTLIQLVFVWLPTLMSIALSFMRWNGLALTDIRPAGLGNYQYISQDYPPFWPAM